MASSVTVEGEQRVIAKLKTLPGKIEKKITRTALRKSAKLVQSKAKSLVPVGRTGQLKKQIKVRAMKRKRGRVGIMVRVWGGGFTDAFYASFVQFGHDLVRGDKVVGRIDANDFLKAASESQEQQIRNLIITDIRQGIAEAGK